MFPRFSSTAPVYEITAETVSDPEATVEKLHLQWSGREPVVVRLHVSPGELKDAARETTDKAPWSLGPQFLFHGQRLHFLVWNNNWDFRSGEAVWWWTKKAEAVGASVDASGDGDIVIDGQSVWCDGGPLQPLDVPTIPYTNIQARSLTPIGNSSADAELATDQSEAVHHAGGPARDHCAGRFRQNPRFNRALTSRFT